MTDPRHQSVSSQDPASSSSQAYRGLTLLLLALCLLVAALLRFSALDLMEYKRDEGAMIQLVSKLVDDGVFLTRGQLSSKGTHNSPLASYLLAPAWVVVQSPIALAWLIALFNVAAVGVTYWIGQRFLSPRAGLVASACMAVSPWAVFLSRKIWLQDMVPLFSALLLAATLVLVIESRRRAIFWVLLWSGVVAQLHMTGYLVVGAVLLFLVVHRPRISPLALVLGLVALGGLYLPYGVFLAGGGWKEWLALLSHRGGAGNPTSWLQQIEPIWHLVNLGNLAGLIGETSYYLDVKLGLSAFLLYPLAALERWVFIGSFVWLAWTLLHPRRESQRLRPLGALLCLWIVLLAAACLLAPWRCPPHYYVATLPALFLVLGVGVDRGIAGIRAFLGTGSKYRVASGLVSLALVGILLTQVHFTATIFSLLRVKGGASGEYGVAYRHKVSLADHLAQAYGPGCYRLTHEWRPLYDVDVGAEVDDLVRRRATTRPCQTSTPAELFVLETIDRPLSPEAEARLRPYRRFGPIFLYVKAANHEP